MTRKASDAAIVRVAERWGEIDEHAGFVAKDYGDIDALFFTDTCDREQSLSDALLAHFGADVPASLAGYVLPVVVDPIDAVALAKTFIAFSRSGASFSYPPGSLQMLEQFIAAQVPA